MTDKWVYFKPFLIVLFFFVMLFAYSKFGPTIPFSANLQLKEQPISVTAEGKAVVPNDTAKITVGIEESNTSLVEVQNSVNAKTKTLVDALKKLGIEESDIKTVSYNIYPQQDFVSSPTARIVGYTVSTNYEVKIKNIDKVNEALIEVIRAGANTIGSVTFDVNEETKLEKMNEAREEAVKKAKEKAEGLAKAAGITLGRVTGVFESEVGGVPPMPLIERSIGGDVTKIEPEVVPGTNEITVSITLTYEIR